VRSIQTAVKIFGEGNVYGIFVMGLEPRKTFLDGVRELTGRGANVVPFVWSPIRDLSWRVTGRLPANGFRRPYWRPLKSFMKQTSPRALEIIVISAMELPAS